MLTACNSGGGNTSPYQNTTLYRFTSGTDGTYPLGALIQASDGNFYGTTQQGDGYGTVFKITPQGVKTTFSNFTNGTNGIYPYAGVIQASDGNLYGTTYQGGNDYGTVFKITSQGVTTTLYSFASNTDGAQPLAGLIQGSDGNFYGTTYQGGSNNAGIVFQITPQGVKTTLYSFTGGTDGANLYAGVIQASDGNFYGTTYQGGNNGYGTVFQITPQGVKTTLYSFAGGNDGAYPTAGLIQASDGNFYGTTSGGGNGNGTVFKITSSGVKTTLYNFSSGNDGAQPQAGLIQGSDGNLYGTTEYGGSCSSGTVFKITPQGVKTTLYSFAGGNDGAYPLAGVIQASDGNFYGTTSGGGNGFFGTVFKLTQN